MRSTEESVRFQIKGRRGERAFKGTLSDDGKSISGDYSQGGYTIPFSVTRTGDARIEAAVKNAAIGKELEGVWNGTLDADREQLRAMLTLVESSRRHRDRQPGSPWMTGWKFRLRTITQKASSLHARPQGRGRVLLRAP